VAAFRHLLKKIKENQESSPKSEFDIWLEENLGDAPDEVLDDLMNTLMKNPYVLPKGHHMDYEWLNSCLTSKGKHPFTNEPLTIDECKPGMSLSRSFFFSLCSSLPPFLSLLPFLRFPRSCYKAEGGRVHRSQADRIRQLEKIIFISPPSLPSHTPPRHLSYLSLLSVVRTAPFATVVTLFSMQNSYICSTQTPRVSSCIRCREMAIQGAQGRDEMRRRESGMLVGDV
jgi:hypothetical protein